MKQGADLITRIGLVLAIVFVGYNLGNRPTTDVDFAWLADVLVDAGFDFRESSQELELLEARKILITTDINARSGQKVVEKLLILNERDPEAPIDLYLRTEGGWEADAFSIIDTMGAIQAPVNVHGIGEVHSSGLMILTAGTGERIVYPNTLLGYHCLDEDEGALWIERYNRLWEEHSDQPDDWLKRRDGDFIYFDAEDALVHGFADKMQKLATE